ncbi:hypothetical protein RO07_13635 [Pandoraea pulmonicola]|uniref:Uncharacterized protein n=1 Tax=Pandoraea pulmonicola TaxID=93221 RepID=A0ABM5S0K2_PANPU|nr:hypothetical protein RO07_13635 [Pandoraea pulmonicola]
MVIDSASWLAPVKPLMPALWGREIDNDETVLIGEVKWVINDKNEFQIDRLAAHASLVSEIEVLPGPDKKSMRASIDATGQINRIRRHQLVTQGKRSAWN